MTNLITETDLAVGRDMAMYSAWAYPDSTPKDFSKWPVIHSVDWVVEGQFSAIIIREIERTIISITGTRNLHNFITDARCVQRTIGQTGKMQVHTGFWEGLEALWPKLEKTINESGNLWLTGHSLGGAIARLMVLNMQLCRSPYPRGIVTIGEPRSLNRYTADFLDDSGIYSRRWVNKFDIVPRVPLVTLLPPRHLFWHCDHSIWMDPTGGLDADKPWYQRIPQDLRGVWREYKARKGEVFVRDHSAALYLATLNQVKLKLN